MKTRKVLAILFLILGFMFIVAQVSEAAPMGTAFTYQGRLIDGEDAADGLYDLQFSLWDDPCAAADVNQLGEDVNLPGVDAVDGYFTVELDFGNEFDGNRRWLEIGVRPGEQEDPNVYTELSPRQELSPAPYAIRAKTDGDWVVSGNNMYSAVSGNIGIGTSTPSAPLNIQTKIGPEIEFTSSGPNADIMSDGTLKIGTFDGGTFYILTGNQYRVKVDAAGNVGIGTLTPQCRLDVKGDVNSAGSYRIDGQYVLSATSERNTFLGIDAGSSNTGNDNTFMGYQAGLSNTTGGSNLFSGSWAGKNATTGYHNTFLGSQAGYSNTTGARNTFIGTGSGSQNETSNSNTFVGDHSGLLSAGGSENTFIGASTGRDNTGYGNTFLGTMSGVANTSGSQNVFAGRYAGGQNADGGSNTFVGDSTGSSNVSGDENVFVGKSAGYANTSGSGNVFLGYQAGYDETGSDKLYIANGRSDADVLIYGDFSTGKVGIGTTSPQEELDVEGDAHIKGQITKAYTTGTSNRAAPIAYAFINSDGSVASGTPNVSCTWDGDYSRYEITISGENYLWTNYVTVVTVAADSSPRIATTNSVSNKLLVNIFTTGGTKVQDEFQFVTYKP